MLRALTILVVTAGLALVPGGVAQADVEVTIGDDGFEPEAVEAGVREPITWTNATDGEVSLIGEDPAWESGVIEPGATFALEIIRPGRYAYGTEDGSVSGEIRVERGGDGGGDDAAEGGEARSGHSDEVVDPGAGQQLPETGLDVMVPAVLSLLLIGFGTGLLRVTEPFRP